MKEDRCESEGAVELWDLYCWHIILSMGTVMFLTFGDSDHPLKDPLTFMSLSTVVFRMVVMFPTTFSSRPPFSRQQPLAVRLLDTTLTGVVETFIPVIKLKQESIEGIDGIDSIVCGVRYVVHVLMPHTVLAQTQ